MTPNKDQIFSIVRTILAWLAGATVVHAFFDKIGVVLDDGTITVLAGLIAGGVAFVWSLFNHTKAATVAKAADIVSIPKAVQESAGVANPVLVPTRPKE